MFEGLQQRKYVQSAKKKSAPFSLMLSFAVFVIVLTTSIGLGRGRSLVDNRGLMIVFGGTIASLLFQFDLQSVWNSIVLVCRSFFGTPDRPIQSNMKVLDRAIIAGYPLTQLKKADGLTGDLLNDVIYMYQKGLTYDEIDAFVTGRVQDEYFERELATALLQKASLVAPSFGLFGTVVGLVQVMQTMSSPGQIGPAMSLALMTTAYGAGSASVIFTPLAGRLEHHNHVFLESHQQLLSKIGILIRREEQNMDVVRGDLAA